MADKHFLLVDDDAIFLDTLARALERKSFKVSKAATLAEAITLAQACIPDYAVVDLKLDKESGLDVLEPLKQINPELRILMLTGYSSIATAVSAIKQGAINYACKPLSAEEILAMVMDPEAQQLATDFDPPSVERLEWEHIQRVLEANNGNVSATARSLGMHRRTLQRKLSKRPVRK